MADPTAQAMQELLKSQGHADSDISAAMKQYGYDSFSLKEPVVNDPTPADVAVHSAESSAVAGWAKGKLGADINEFSSAAIDAVDFGLLNVAKVDVINDKLLRGRGNAWATQTMSRTGNVAELLLAAVEPMWRRPQQALFGWQAGESRNEILQRLLPEVEVIASDKEPTPFMGAMEQLFQMFKAGVSGNTERLSILADMEPRLFEDMERDLTFQDVLIQGPFQGDEESYNQWLHDTITSKGGGPKLAALAGATAFADMFADPAAAGVETAIVGARAVKAIKPFIKVERSVMGKFKGVSLRSLDGAKIEQLTQDINKGLSPQKRAMSDVANIQRRAQSQRDRALSRYRANPQDADAALRVVQAEKRLAEANTGLNRFKQGPATTLSYRKIVPEEPIITRGKTASQIRREMAANQIAPRSSVDWEVQELFGERVKSANLDRHLRKAAKDVKENGIAADKNSMETLNKYHRLSDKSKAHLEARGISAPRVVSDEALRTVKLADPEPWMFEQLGAIPGKFGDELPTVMQRAVLGPDDGELAGDMGQAFAAGVDISALKGRAFGMPEYSLLRGAPAHMVDGSWVREFKAAKMPTVEKGGRLGKVGRKNTPEEIESFKKLKDGKVLSASNIGDTLGRKKQLDLFADRIKPGLATGSKWIRPSAAFAKGMYSMVREPRGALRGQGATPIFERWRAGALNYETGVGGDMEHLGIMLERAKVVKRTKAGDLKVTQRERAEHLFDMLDTDKNSDKFTELFDSSSEGEREAYAQIRKWLDDMADRQGIPMVGDGVNGPRISDYARHLFTEDMFADGARPVELLGLPASFELTASHLLPRLNKAGYEKDVLNMLENYIRAANRKIHMEPTYRDLLEMADATDNRFTKAYVNMWVGEMKGLPQGMDAILDNIQHSLGMSKLPTASRAGLAVSNLFYASLLSGNPNYLIQNLGTGVLNSITTKGGLHTANGMLMMATPEGRKVAKAVGVDRAWQRIYEGPVGELSKLMAKFGGSDYSEFVNRGFSFHAGISDIITKSGRSWQQLQAEGLAASSLWEALNNAEIVQHIYGVGGRSPLANMLLGKGLGSAATQFLSFPFKQGGFLANQFVEGNVGGIMRYFAYSGMMQRIAADELGIDASQFVGLGFIPKPRANRPGPLSPGMEALFSLMDFQAAINTGDPEAMFKAEERVRSAITAALPGVAIMARSMTAVKELKSGEVRQRRGGKDELVREINLDKELIPTLLQTRSVEDRKQNQIDTQYRQNLQNQMFFRQKVAEEIGKLVRMEREGGDTRQQARRIQDAVETLAKLGIELSPDAGKRYIEAMYISRTLRELGRNPTFLPPNMLQELIEEQ